MYHLAWAFGHTLAEATNNLQIMKALVLKVIIDMSKEQQWTYKNQLIIEEVAPNAFSHMRK